MCSILTFLGMPVAAADAVIPITIANAEAPQASPYPFTLADNGETWCCGMPNCSKRIPTTKKSLIVYHRNTHCPKYECEHCGELFPQKSRMETHIRTTHTGEKPYACQHCERAFPQLSNLQDHVRKNHMNVAAAAEKVCANNPIPLNSARAASASASALYSEFRERMTAELRSAEPSWSYPQIVSEVALRWRAVKKGQVVA